MEIGATWCCIVRLWHLWVPTQYSPSNHFKTSTLRPWYVINVITIKKTIWQTSMGTTTPNPIHWMTNTSAKGRPNRFATFGSLTGVPGFMRWCLSISWRRNRQPLTNWPLQPNSLNPLTYTAKIGMDSYIRHSWIHRPPNSYPTLVSFPSENFLFFLFLKKPSTQHRQRQRRPWGKLFSSGHPAWIKKTNIVHTFL